MHPNPAHKRRATLDTKVRLRNKSDARNVRGARAEAGVRSDQAGRRVDLSSLDALKIIRQGLNDSRPATAFDWDKVERLVGGASQDAPMGSISLKDWMTRYNCKETQGRRKLMSMVTDGIMDTGMFYDRSINSHTRRWWFKVTP